MSSNQDFNTLKLGAVALGVGPIAGIILGLFLPSFLKMLISPLYLLVFIGSVVLFSINQPEHLKKGGILAAFVMVVHWIINLGTLFIPMPEITTNMTTNELTQAVDEMIIISAFGVVVAIILMIGTVLLTKWLDELFVEHQIPQTKIMMFYGGTNLFGSVLFLPSCFLLRSVVEKIENNPTAALGDITGALLVMIIAAIFLLAGIVIQIIAGVKIYSRSEMAITGRRPSLFQSLPLLRCTECARQITTPGLQQCPWCGGAIRYEQQKTTAYQPVYGSPNTTYTENRPIEARTENYCQQCGQPVNDANQQFCSSCGSRL